MNYNNNQILLEKAVNGDERATEELMTNNLGLVRSIALKFKDRGVEYDDLVQIGSIGMLKAIRSFDLEKGTVTLANPSGNIFDIDMELFEKRFSEVGSYAVIIK